MVPIKRFQNTIKLIQDIVYNEIQIIEVNITIKKKKERRVMLLP